MRPTSVLVILSCAGAAIAIGHADAQSPATPSPPSAPAVTATSPADASRHPPCPTVAQQSGAAGQKTATGTEVAAAQPAERSGILPSATGPGMDKSAAPTVTTQGEAVRSPVDCALVPGHPNAPPDIVPGRPAPGMPEKSPPPPKG